jgi:hypothetical protein
MTAKHAVTHDLTAADKRLGIGCSRSGFAISRAGRAGFTIGAIGLQDNRRS